MEVLAFVGIFIKGAVWCGYALSAGYGVATVSKYVKDYKDSVKNEKNTY